MDNISEKMSRALAGAREGIALYDKRKTSALQRKKLEQELAYGDQPLPKGFVRAGGNVYKDPTYFDEETARKKAQVQFDIARDFMNQQSQGQVSTPTRTVGFTSPDPNQLQVNRETAPIEQRNTPIPIVMTGIRGS